MWALRFPKKITDNQTRFLDKLLRGVYFPLNDVEKHSIREALLHREYTLGQQCLFNDLGKRVIKTLKK